MLLFFLKETNKSAEARYTFEQIEQWYGITRRTAQNGVKELLDARLLTARRETAIAPLSKTGRTVRIHYSLTGDYGRDARRALQDRARTARNARNGSGGISDHPHAPTGTSAVKRRKKLKKSQPGTEASSKREHR